MALESPRGRVEVPDLVGARSKESRLAPSSIGFIIVSRPDVVKLGEADDGPKVESGSNVNAVVGGTREGDEETKARGSAGGALKE